MDNPVPPPPSPPEDQAPLKILLADDDPILREGFGVLLAGQHDVELVAAVADGDAALEVLRTRFVDVALLDVEMPRKNGVETARIIAAQYPSVVVVMFTAFENRASLAEAMGVGARGFLTKDIPITDVVASLRRIIAGETVLGAEPARMVVESFRNRARRQEDSAEFRQRVAELPERLKGVYSKLARGLSNRAIAGEVHMTEGSVRTYVTEILCRLECDSRTEVVLKAAILDADLP